MSTATTAVADDPKAELVKRARSAAVAVREQRALATEGTSGRG